MIAAVALAIGLVGALLVFAGVRSEFPVLKYLGVALLLGAIATQVLVTPSKPAAPGEVLLVATPTATVTPSPSPSPSSSPSKKPSPKPKPKPSPSKSPSQPPVPPPPTTPFHTTPPPRTTTPPPPTFSPCPLPCTP